MPERTRGQSVVDGFDERIRTAEALGDAQDVELARLDRQIESARRDGGTGLLERAVHYENLEQAFKEGKEVQMVFVDMGFLRYFDNKGGADVGNDALKVAADLMEEAIEKSGVEGKAFRYGGDEFTVQIDGGDAEVAKFQQKLAELRAESGAIPTGKRGTADGYHPTELVFNYGGADMETAEAVFSDLQKAGKFADADLEDQGWVANKKAEIMTIIADKSIEEQKAIGRFQMLVEAKNDSAYDTDPARKVQVDNLVAFSNKALFAEKGGGDFLTLIAERQKAEMAEANKIPDKQAREKAVGEIREATKKSIEEKVAEYIKETREQEDRKAD
ncbi:diguanylate cyclase, partial [Patescibacteria group bacterium]